MPEKTFTLTITTWEPLTEEEMKDRDRGSYVRGMHTPDMPYNQREVRVLTVQLTESEWKAVKKATIEAVM